MENHSILNDIVSIKSQPSRIMAMGVGGAGANAIQHMWEMQIEGVNLAAANTDQADLDKLHIPEENRILLGEHGMGAGDTLDMGAELAMGSLDKVRDLFKTRGTEMLFLAAGMGAGTGSGASPVIAELAHELGILTVAIVTMPPVNEGFRRTEQAKEGVSRLRKYVDAMIILSNDVITELYGHLPASQGFDRANDIVAFAAKGIAEIITHKTNLVHVDFADVCKVLRGSGNAIMGVATETGEDRADKVVDSVLNSPLFNNVSISGARDVLINISVSSADGLTLNEAHRVRDRVQHYAKSEDDKGNILLTNIIWGMSIKPNLNEDEMEVVIVATGFDMEKLVVKIKPEPEPPVDDVKENGAVVDEAPKTNDSTDEESVVAPAEIKQPKTTTHSISYTPAPIPIARPVRNFAEFEDCKRTPAYLKHGIKLSVSNKVNPVAGLEVEPQSDDSTEMRLFN